MKYKIYKSLNLNKQVCTCISYMYVILPILFYTTVNVIQLQIKTNK